MSKILLLSQDNIGHSMAGPGIRYFEFAKALSKKHEVTLLIPNEVKISSPEFKIQQQTGKTIKEAVKSSDVLISQLIPKGVGLLAKINGVKIILDVYDPMPIENLEVYKHHSDSMKSHANASVLKLFKFSFSMADTFISANNKQKDLWMGFLMNMGKITSKVYEEHNNLKNLIDNVPFGLSSVPPSSQIEDGFRKRLGIKETDHVLLWGGGVWNWFDPLTLIHAVSEISKDRDDVYLVFMGIKHPNPHVPEMKMVQDAVALSKEVGLFDKKIFFNFGWTAYEERQDYLTGSTIGVSLHFDNLETQFAFRTRILDYLWAGLPIIGTEGDFFAEQIQKNDLGIVVPEKDIDAVKNAILTLIDNPQRCAKIKENISNIRPQYHWEKVVDPINQMVENFSNQPKTKMSSSDLLKILSLLIQKYSPKSIYRYVTRKD